MKALMYIIGISLLLLSACKNPVYLEDRVYYDSYNLKGVDILFVVDSSGSMAMSPSFARDYFAKGKTTSDYKHEHGSISYTCDGSNSVVKGSKICVAGESVSEIIDMITTGGNKNFSIGITTSTHNGKLVGEPITSTEYGYSQSKSMLEEGVQDLAEEIFKSGSKQEEMFEASKNAVELSGSSNFYNADWYNPEHNLVIIYIGDEDDSSSGTCSSVGNCISWFRDKKKAFNARVSFHAIADLNQTCHVGSTVGFNLGAKRFREIVDATAGELASMCGQQRNSTFTINSNDYVQYFESVGRNLNRNFPLHVVPDLKKLEVLVDGRSQSLNEHFTYDPVKKSVVFHHNYTPVQGSHLEFTYAMGSGLQ